MGTRLQTFLKMKVLPYCHLNNELGEKVNLLLKKLSRKQGVQLTVLASFICSISMVACANNDVASAEAEAIEKKETIAVAEAAKESTTEKAKPKDYGPPLDFRGTLDGAILDLTPMEGEVFTDQAKKFMATGENPYIHNKEAIEKGYTAYSTACSGCHGHLAEGKLGPALADDYWTYPKNETDKGLFETIYGGANGMMGPQKGRLKVDEIIQIIAWIRHQKEVNDQGGASEH